MPKKTYHHGNLREALIDAAHLTLATEGVAGLSLRKVAQQAGVSATALYSHFKDKRELLALLASQGFEQLSASMEIAAHTAASAPGAQGSSLVGLACAYIRFSMDNTALFHLMFGREVGNLLDFPMLVEAGSKSYALMADCVTTELGNSDSAASPAIAATAAWSIVHGLATLINDGRVSASACGVESNDELIRLVCQSLNFGS